MSYCQSVSCAKAVGDRDMDIDYLREQLKAATAKAMDAAFRAQALSDKLRTIERDTLFRAANICRTYAHTDEKHSQTRRQVAYACQRRIEEAAREIKVDALNDRMETLAKESTNGQHTPSTGPAGP